jgi:hypothetical protein
MSFRSSIVGFLLCVSIVVPSTCFAASPQATGALDYQIWMAPEPGKAIVLVSSTIPQTVELPATVRIPIPAGMTVEWAGELGGGDASSDIERPYTVGEGSGGQYAEFEIQQFRQAQIDVSGKTIPVGVGEVKASFGFVQAVPSDQAGFSVRVPAGASNVKITPKPVGNPETNQAGESLYTLAGKQLKLGDTTTIEVAYKVGAATSSGGGSGATGTVVAVLVFGLLLAVVALVVALRRSRARD